MVSVGTAPALAQTEIGNVIVSTVHRLQEAENALRAVGELGGKPLAKYLFQLQRQAQQYVAGLACACGVSCLQNAFDFMVVEARDDGRNHYADGDAGIR